MRGFLGPEEESVAVDDVAVAEHLRQEWTRRLVDERADEVGRVDGLAGGRAHLRHDDEARGIAVDRREQQQVGETEVGQRLPCRRQPLHVPQRITPKLGAR